MAKNRSPQQIRVTPLGVKPAPADLNDVDAAQTFPHQVWFLDADLRQTGQVFRNALVSGFGTEPGTLRLCILRTEALDGATGLEERDDVPFHHTARLEDWGPGKVFCAGNLLPARQRAPEPATRHAEPARRERQRPPQSDRPERGPTAPRGGQSEPDELDAFLSGGAVRRGANAG